MQICSRFGAGKVRVGSGPDETKNNGLGHGDGKATEPTLLSVPSRESITFWILGVKTRCVSPATRYIYGATSRNERSTEIVRVYPPTPLPMFRNLLTITKLSPGLIFHPDPLPARTCNSKLPPAADRLFCLKTQLGSVAGVAAEECEDACFCSGANVLDQILHSIQANALLYGV